MSKNFLFPDCELLVELISKYKNIIENKKTNALANHKKEETWQVVTNEFNAVCQGVKRTKEQLKNKYKHMKHEAQKNQNGLNKVIAVSTISIEGSDSSIKMEIPDEPEEIFGTIITPPEEDSLLNEIPNNHHNTAIVPLQQDQEESLPAPNFKDSEVPKQTDKSSRGLKRKPNASIEVRDALIETTKIRKKCCELESEQLMRHREEEHEMKKKEHELRINILKEEHEIKLNVLKEKLLYYQNLNKNVAS